MSSPHPPLRVPRPQAPRSVFRQVLFWLQLPMLLLLPIGVIVWRALFGVVGWVSVAFVFAAPMIFLGQLVLLGFTIGYAYRVRRFQVGHRTAAALSVYVLSSVLYPLGFVNLADHSAKHLPSPFEVTGGNVTLTLAIGIALLVLAAVSGVVAVAVAMMDALERDTWT